MASLQIGFSPIRVWKLQDNYYCLPGKPFPPSAARPDSRASLLSVACFGYGLASPLRSIAFDCFSIGPLIVLIIGTIIIYNQLNYIRNKDIGFRRDNILIIKNTYALGTQATLLKTIF
jgi:hypothetical protein